MKPTILRNRAAQGLLSGLISVVAGLSAAAFTYTDFNSTNGLSLVGDTVQVGSALRLTPPEQDKKGAVWYSQKQFCAGGFTTSFRFRITDLGAVPGIETGGDGISFSMQSAGPDALATEYGAETNGVPPNCLGVSLNTFWNPGLEPSGNFVGICTNGGNWLLQRDVGGFGINLSDGNDHRVEIKCNSGSMTVAIDSIIVIADFPVPLAQGLDADGNGWIGFGARTGGAWENHDILSWTFNRAPVAKCKDVSLTACTSVASIDDGSFDPDGDPISVSQSPPGPYLLGTNTVVLTVTDDKGASSTCTAHVIVLNNPPAFIYTNFDSTAGLNLTGDAARMGTALRLTPAAQDKKGAAWYAQKQFCRKGFATSFRFRIGDLGSQPGVEPGGDGISFCLQDGSATALGTEYGAEVNETPPNCLGISLNTFWNAGLEPSGNFIGICTNGGNWLVQKDLGGIPINLSDGKEHTVEINCIGHSMDIILDGQAVIVGFPVSLAQCTDASGYSWVGFGSRTGWAWENHDILSWVFSNSSCDHAPVAQCADVVVEAGPDCMAKASIDNGSYDPDGGPVTVSQTPPGPYPIGTNLVTLTVADSHGGSNSCTAFVVVQDKTPPTMACPGPMVLEFQDEKGAAATFSATANDTCSPATVVATPPSGSVFGIGATPVLVCATDGSGNAAQCSFSITVLGAQGVKSNVLAELVALRGAPGTSQSSVQKLDDAIGHLAQSLDPKYWIDQTHLQLKSGGAAMNEEKLAAKALSQIADSKKASASPGSLLGCIDRIVKCDRLLAVVSIQDAARAGANPKRIELDLALVKLGDRSAAAGRCVPAIELYRDAWLHALLQQVRVKLNPDGTAHLEFIGSSGTSYRVEASSDMVHWTSLGTCTADGDGNAEFTDATAANASARFYRAVEQ